MGQMRAVSIMWTIFISSFLFHYSVLAAANNDESPAFENETVPDRIVTEIVPDPVTIKPPGSTEVLKPNLVGLANMAIVHLPRRLTFDHVIYATREIVDGVRYELLVHSKDIEKTEVICRLVVKEKPWITTEFGDKYRELINTNCTTTSEDDTYDPNKYEGNTVFNSSNTEVTHGELSDLEKQILAAKKKKPADFEETTTIKGDADINMGIIRGIETLIIPPKRTTIRPSLSEDSFALLSSLFGMAEVDSTTVVSETTENAEPILCGTSPFQPNAQPDGYYSYPIENKNVNSETEIITKSESQTKDISESSKSFLDSIFMKPVDEPEPVIVRVTPPTDVIVTGEPAQRSPIEKLENNAPVDIQGKLEIDTAFEPGTEQLNEMKIEVAQEQDAANAEQSKIQQSEVTIEESSQSALSRATEVVAAESEPCALNVVAASDGRPLLGGAKVVPKSEYADLQTLLTTSLTIPQLAASGQDTLTGLTKIYCATTQVVAGTLEKIHGQFTTNQGNKKDCIAEIWSRPWVSSTPQITYNCNLNAIRKRSVPDAQKELAERVLEQIPAEVVQRANGQPLFSKIKDIYLALERTENGRQHYLIEGDFELLDGTIEMCELILIQHPNRYNDVKWKCNDKNTEFEFSFFPSVLSIPHSKRTKEQKLFAKFIKNHNRGYAYTQEEDERFKLFSLNLQRIKLFNEMEQGTAKYGITDFTDMTAEEYSKRLGLRYDEYLAERNHIRHPMAEIPDIELPKSFDWREKGVITKVKNQGACGSCWAFSVTGNIEGIHAVKTGQLEEYSEQELVDCDSVDHGCAGGLPDNAYKAIEEIGGLELEDEYPYKGRQDKCAFNKTMSHVKVKGAIDFPKNETAMALWLVQNGPISIGINANGMQFYRGGISHPWRMLCRHSGIDHGVLVVGFGVAEYPVFNKTIPYWIVKNSWGKQWGEQGYYRVFRGDDTCGISDMASSAVLAD